MKMTNKIKSILASLSFIIGLHANLTHAQDQYSAQDMQLIQKYLLKNISSKDNIITHDANGQHYLSKPGAVIASPSDANNTPNFNMDYVRNFVRNEAITMQLLVQQYAQADEPQKKEFMQYFQNYIQWVETTQNQLPIHGISPLAEPTFHIDGSIWPDKMARPQYDGPALRAIALIGIYNIYNSTQQSSLQLNKIYALIEANLDYIVTHWAQPSYSIWEEMDEEKDLHFFTEMVQRKAMLLGAALENQNGQKNKAIIYARVAAELHAALKAHWNDSLGYYHEGLDCPGVKGGGLNSAVILAALLGNIHEINDDYAVSSDKMLSTAFFLSQSFKNLYLINIAHPELAPVMGRYHADQYDGNKLDHGNPWFALTHAYAEFYFIVAKEIKEKKKIIVTNENIHFLKNISPDMQLVVGMELSQQATPQYFNQIITNLISLGDALLARSKSYSQCYASDNCLHLSEQIDRASGVAVSAKDLTFSYTSLISAWQARENL